MSNEAGPSILGWIKTSTGSYSFGFFFLGSSML